MNRRDAIKAIPGIAMGGAVAHIGVLPSAPAASQEPDANDQRICLVCGKKYYNRKASTTKWTHGTADVHSFECVTAYLHHDCWPWKRCSIEYKKDPWSTQVVHRTEQRILYDNDRKQRWETVSLIQAGGD